MAHPARARATGSGNRLRHTDRESAQIGKAGESDRTGKAGDGRGQRGKERGNIRRGPPQLLLPPAGPFRRLDCPREGASARSRSTCSSSPFTISTRCRTHSRSSPSGTDEISGNRVTGDRQTGDFAFWRFRRTFTLLLINHDFIYRIWPLPIDD